jgi:hypothetical protein
MVAHRAPAGEPAPSVALVGSCLWAVAGPAAFGQNGAFCTEVRMRIPCLVAVAAIVLAVLPAGAQTLKPGLWEIHNKIGGNPQMDNAMAEMQKHLQSMTPEQRKQMEATMSQRGVRMAPGAGAGGGMSMQICMTQEMVERHEAPMRDGCRTTKQERSGNKMKIAFSCDRPPSSGEGEVTFASPEAYNSHMTMTVSEQGRKQTSTIDASGKWLKADCGNVKPVQPRK